jgi:TorA maturation chaperone TorD
MDMEAGLRLGTEEPYDRARPSLNDDGYSVEDGVASADKDAAAPDEIALARAAEYALLASLLLRAPDAATLRQLAGIKGSANPIGLAHIALAQAAGATSAEAVEREFFELFVGVGRGELLPYASYYLTGFLSDRPLVRLRDDLRRLGLERADGHSEPEDHLGTLCEVMSGLASGEVTVSRGDDEERFFARHLAPWAIRFFSDLEVSKSAGFYRTVGALGRLFMTIEAEAFAMEH